MRVWRLQRRVYPPLDGDGARRSGGRWNSRGVAVVYTSQTLSLASLELLVHVDPDLIPADLASFELEIPDALAVATVDVSALPADWRQPEHPYCKALGDAWIGEGRVPLLRVPSVIIPHEPNVLINPSHPDAARITVVDQTEFAFDLRLLR
jgi:RES domain-containing protein